VRDDGLAQCLAVPTVTEGGVPVATVGRRTADNSVVRPAVTIMLPGESGTAYNLIVDGDARVIDDRIAGTPTWACCRAPRSRLTD
jgi:hypothetical protein